MRLRHRTQRGGEIILSGDPLPAGAEFRAQVDKRGYFEAPDHLGRCLVRFLAPDVIEVTDSKSNEGE